MELIDNKDGTAVLGGIPKDVLLSSDMQVAKIRGYTLDGGFSDLDINYTVIKDEQYGLFPKKLPGYKGVINFGENVSITMIDESLDGKYFVGGNFAGSILLGDHNLKQIGESDSFLANMEANGTVIDFIHLISNERLRVGAALSADNGDTYVMGHFSGKLKTGQFEVQSSGGTDLFILHWGSDGNVKNLSILGGTSNEFFVSATNHKNKLFLAGTFDGTFSQDSHFVNSRGSTDGFILQTTTNDASSIQWLQSFGGEFTEKVCKIEMLKSGRLLLGGSFSKSVTFGDKEILYNAVGLSDCFVAYINDSGEWDQVYTLGGSGNDEITGISSLTDNQIMITGNFFGSIKCGNIETFSKGKRDGFIALLNELGDCISLQSVGGTGTDGINSFIMTDKFHKWVFF